MRTSAGFSLGGAAGGSDDVRAKQFVLRGERPGVERDRIDAHRSFFSCRVRYGSSRRKMLRGWALTPQRSASSAANSAPLGICSASSHSLCEEGEVFLRELVRALRSAFAGQQPGKTLAVEQISRHS